MVQANSSIPENNHRKGILEIDRFFPLKIKEKYINFNNKTLIMGVLNVTPDSFYDGGKYNSVDKSLLRIEEMLAHGADIIDIGGESTRPGSGSISEDDELKRVIPVLEKSLKKFDTLFSVDTTKSKVAKEALDLGVSIINDISGLQFDKEIANHVSKHRAAIILMHTPSRPLDMQDKTDYKDIMNDIKNSLSESIRTAVDYGINLESIVLDPGIGFGKTVDQNLKIINQLDEFLEFKRPVLIGTSRKSFIGKLLENVDVEERLEGTLASVVASIIRGASIVRVHDVKEIKRASIISDAIVNIH